LLCIGFLSLYFYHALHIIPLLYTLVKYWSMYSIRGLKRPWPLKKPPGHNNLLFVIVIPYILFIPRLLLIVNSMYGNIYIGFGRGINNAFVHGLNFSCRVNRSGSIFKEKL
jgi:hypothetical protein